MAVEPSTGMDRTSLAETADKAARAHASLAAMRSLTQADVDRIVASMGRAAAIEAARLGEAAHRETGFGNIADKTTKNLFAAERVASHIASTKTVGVLGDDPATGITEIGEPMGVVAAIIPSTNPTSTAIFKALIAVKARCPIVLSPHPSARTCVLESFRVLEIAALASGLPDGALQCLEVVSIAGTEALMKSRHTAVILATGGIGLVRAAYSSGKPAYGVGPGNVPVYVHRSADPGRAVRDVIAGKTFDYGTLCSSEQALVFDSSISAEVMKALEAERVHILSNEEASKVAAWVITERGIVNAKAVGRSAQALAEAAGFKVAEGTRALGGRVAGVGREHPLSAEKLCPVLALYEVSGPDEGIKRCQELLAHGGTGHTAGIHAAEEDLLRRFALAQPASRVIANSQTSMGATGHTTHLEPSMSLGCGAAAGNITSDNITPLHLINIKRLARVRTAVSGGAVPAKPAKIPVKVETVDFVCEDDVVRARREGRRIFLNKKAIVTPAARDAAQGNDVLVSSRD
ncbi:MAG: aldehyde dehydrogenase family protein [Vicinamibacteria bacterium]|nr:aldehyde dehydrogenase family protein [Vicinamibacteria bacterium]